MPLQETQWTIATPGSGFLTGTGRIDGRIELTNHTAAANPLFSYFRREEKPMSSSPSPTQAIAKDIEALPGGADLSFVKAAVERAEREQRARIMKAVESQADLCHMAGPKTKRFVVAYWLGESIVKSAEGLEYPVEIGDKDEIVGNNVILNDYRHPFAGAYKSMEAFRERLTSMDLPHSIAYFDR